ncbi:MAG: FimV/HubP family polar landmark protein [Steroidobacteraceae bacterium]
MRRHIPRLLLIGALLSPSTPYALGLGDIRLNSALNQPFDAEIDLLSATAEELSSLQVGLANAETFTRYGLDRPPFLSSFTFRVTRAADGRTVLRVVSSPSVTEPFVTLLVEANWSRGRLLREYTVLLDPPVFTPGANTATAPVAAPRAGAPAGGAIERPQAPVAPQPVASDQPTQAAPIGDSYRVQRNDTLWEIASRIRPGSIRVVNQTMIALFRANPGAFDSNINELRAGSLLRIPGSGEIESIAQSQAAAEVAEQYRNWRGATGAAPQEGGRLRLVTPTESSGAPATGTAPAGNADGLRQQVSTLEGQLAEAQRLLALRNAELAEMQRRLGQGAAPAAPAATPPAPPEAAPAQPEPAAEPAAATPPPAAEPPAQAPTRPAQVARPEPEPEPSILDLLAQYWWALAGLGVALAAGVALYFRSRRSVDIDEAVETMGANDFGSGTMTSPQPTRSRARENTFVVEEGDDANDTAELQTMRKPSLGASRLAEAATAVATTADDTLSSETAIHFDQQDALAEADFHMAYGLYDQAADLVTIAIERQPDRRDLRLKLLEIFFVWGNKEQFLDSARYLYETRDAAEPGEWDKILIMGRQISPDDPLFQGEAGMSRPTDVVDLNLEGGENRVDVDLFGPDAGEEGKLDMDFTGSDDTKETRSTSDSGIDFLLDEPLRGTDEDPTREIDSSARTQETPTIESPYLADRASQTIREQVDTQAIARVSSGVDQTAELSLDDLGLDVSSFEETGSPLDTDSSVRTGEQPLSGFDLGQNIDDDATRLADHSFIGSYERTVESPRPAGLSDPGTGTVVLPESEGDTIERPRADNGATARMKAVDFDLDSLSAELDSGQVGDNVKRDSGPAAVVDDFSDDVFGAGGTALNRQLDEVSLDLDVGGFAEDSDREPTKTESVTSMMDMPELEPVTMSEVGTKLDLARAYMDMGDPDGARSILEEVLQEGSTNQKQEAERLLDSIR